MGFNIGNLSMPPGFQAASIPGQVSSPTQDMANLMSAQQSGGAVAERSMAMIGSRYGSLGGLASAYAKETGQDPRKVIAGMSQSLAQPLSLERGQTAPRVPDGAPMGPGMGGTPAPAGLNPYSQPQSQGMNPLGTFGAVQGVKRLQGRNNVGAGPPINPEEPGEGPPISPEAGPEIAPDTTETAMLGLDQMGLGGLGMGGGEGAGAAGLGLDELGLAGLGSLGTVGAGVVEGGEMAGVGEALAELAPLLFVKRGGYVHGYEEGGDVDEPTITQRARNNIEQWRDRIIARANAAEAAPAQAAPAQAAQGEIDDTAERQRSGAGMRVVSDNNQGLSGLGREYSPTGDVFPDEVIQRPQPRPRPQVPPTQDAAPARSFPDVDPQLDLPVREVPPAAPPHEATIANPEKQKDFWGNPWTTLGLMGLGILGQPRHWGDGPLAPMARGALEGAVIGNKFANTSETRKLREYQIDSTRQWREEMIRQRDDANRRSTDARREATQARTSEERQRASDRADKLAEQAREFDLRLKEIGANATEARKSREAIAQANRDAHMTGINSLKELYKQANPGASDAEVAKAVLDMQKNPAASMAETQREKAIKFAQGDPEWLIAGEDAAKQDAVVQKYMRHLKPDGAGTAAPPATAVPQSAIDYLKKNPNLKAQFDAKYGDGAADRVLK